MHGGDEALEAAVAQDRRELRPVKREQADRFVEIDVEDAPAVFGGLHEIVDRHRGAVRAQVACVDDLASGLRILATLDRRLGVGVTTLAIVCFLLLMEEISWGQRILGFETPDEIGQINAQQETNLHNMFVGYNQLIRLAIALVIATVLIDRARWVGWLRFSGLDRLMPPAAAIYFVPFLLYAHTYDELFEEVVGLFLLVYVIDLRRRLRDGT